MTVAEAEIVEFGGAKVAALGARLDGLRAYATHLPALIEAILRTEGPVLEVGGGRWSTPLLELACSEMEREIVTIEEDPEWRALLSERFGGSRHAFVATLQGAESMRREMGRLWSVALIDGNLNGRQEALAELAGRAVIIVCHDTLGGNPYGWDFEGFRYRRDWTRLCPPTTVLSNYVEV